MMAAALFIAPAATAMFQMAEEVTLRPTAKEILIKAAKVQGGGKFAAKLNNFRAEFTSEYIKPNKGKVYYEVDRIFKFPSYLWTKKKHEVHKKPSIEAYDGEEGWIRTADGKLTVYTDKPSTYQTDMENLENDARLTKQMFRYFFIANLRNEIHDLTRLPDQPIPRMKKRISVFVLEGKATGWIGEDKTVRLKIFVDPKESLVRAVQMDDLSQERPRRIFLFDVYAKNRQGVLVPTNIKMFTGNEPNPEMKLTIHYKEEEKEGEKKVYPLIDFNLDLDMDLFEIPEEEE
jgi:hypothetical protein